MAQQKESSGTNWKAEVNIFHPSASSHALFVANLCQQGLGAPMWQSHAMRSESCSAQIKKELEQLAKAQVGNPETPFAKTPEISPEFTTLMNESVG